MSKANIYYLKYRPQTLNELIGQEAVKKTLFTSFQNSKLSHAYLFVGPRGTGKTSTARILAKMVNCESQTEGIPCNKCDICLSITDGSNLDLIEIDAASNRGIEDIRSLRDKIKLAPTNARKKVYIIDEVHMLTTEAFNALLKTLEEPPQHVLFILATTESGKIPSTILSRVQRLDFKLASADQLMEVLRRIVKAEKIEIEEEALKVLARKSDGSFRDGVKLLDQLASIGEKITISSIAENLKSAQFDNALDLIKAFGNKDASDGLLSVAKQIESGVDVKELILALMDVLRSLVLIKNGVGEQLVKIQTTEDKYQNLVEASQSLTNQDLIKDLDILQKALEQLKFAGVPSLPLELAVVEICEESSKLEEQENIPIGFVIPADAGYSPNEIQLNTSSSKLDPDIRRDDNEKPEISKTESTSEDILKLKEKWTFVLETVRSSNFSLEALLRSINILECRANTVIIQVPYAFHQRILEAPKNKDLLEGVFSDILDRHIRISTVLGSRPQKKENIVNTEVAQDDEIIKAAAEIFNSDSIN